MTWNELTEVIKAGGPPPAPEPVDPALLRRYWEFTQKLKAQHPPSETGAIGIDRRVLEAEVPGAHNPAVYLRIVPLYLMQAQGALKEWERATGLDDIVFQVAATFPFSGNVIPVESFRQQLRASAGAE
jgi:hypothetical protein